MTSDHGMKSSGALYDEAASQAAVAWFVRQQGGGMSAGDWMAFSDWLGEDDSHAALFDRVVEADGKLDGLDAATFAPEPAETPSRFAWGRLIAVGGSLAAALVLAVTLWPQHGQPAFETLATAPGETRELALDKTIRIELNGATRIAFTRGDAPVVRLETGEAAFYITSPVPSKLRVETGKLTLVDRGTSFDVIHDSYGTRIAVGTGKVVVNPEGEAIELAAGQGFVLPEGSQAGTRRAIAPADMAGWRERRLTYRDTPLPMVASDLGRALGIGITLAPPLSQTAFTGVIPLAGTTEQAIAGAAAVIGGKARRTAEGGWEIGPS